MYGAIKGRFNLDFGFPLCFDLDWFAERECWLQPGSRQCSNGGNTAVQCALHITSPLQGGKKKSWGATHGGTGAGHGIMRRGAVIRGDSPGDGSENWVINV